MYYTGLCKVDDMAGTIAPSGWAPLVGLPDGKIRCPKCAAGQYKELTRFNHFVDRATCKVKLPAA